MSQESSSINILELLLIKKMKFFTTVSAFLCCAGIAQAEAWTLAKSQVTDISTTTDYTWSSLSGTVSEIQAQIISYTGSGGRFPNRWLSYYAGNHNYAYEGYHSYLNAMASVTQRSGTSAIEIQFFTSFSLSDDALSAEKVRVSFSFNQLNRIEFGSHAGSLDGLSGSIDSLKTYNTQFTFGLINLASGEVFDANINGETHTFDGVASDSNLWTAVLDESGEGTVVFELDQESLQSVESEGLGLVIQSKAPTGANFTEDFGLYNFKVEYLAMIPEPSTYAAMLGLMSLGVVCLRRRTFRRK